MTKLLTVSAALLLCVSASQASLAQGRSDDKPGKERGAGPERAQGRDDHPGKGQGRDKGPEVRGSEKRGPEAKGPDRRDDRRDDRGPAVVIREDRGQDRDRDRDRDWDRERPRQVVVVPYRDYGVLQGCPPGLAKKNNGCLPPGQAKKIERARYNLVWRAPVDDVIYRYDDGYQYRYDRRGSLLGYLPALGGALGVGNLWPAQYRYDPAPVYQRDWFGLTQPYDYRYANGALYGVDPQTSTIQQVVALLTGQTPAVGQRMPAGFDIYNVPYAYRDRYVDGPGALYRYNDGAIYQLDPTTQVVQAVIQLLA